MNNADVILLFPLAYISICMIAFQFIKYIKIKKSLIENLEYLY
jgi:hypothetical protein